MEKKVIIDIANSTIRIPSDFTKQFKTSGNHRKLKAKLIYNDSAICTKESLIILIDKN